MTPAETFAPRSSLFQPRPPPGAIPPLLNGDAMPARLRSFQVPTDPETGRPAPYPEAGPGKGGGVMHGLGTMHKAIPWCLVVGGNVAAGVFGVLAANFDASKISASISIIGGVIVAVIVMGIRQIVGAWTEAIKQYNAAYAESLSGKVDSLTGDMKRARESLHEIRNEANQERLRHKDEVGRLTEELKFLRDELHQAGDALKDQRAENRELLARVAQVGRQTKVNAEKITEVTHQQAATTEKVETLLNPPEEPEEPIDQLPGEPRDPG
jgi:outer membrane murein-binding lipoprotein Lpp